MYICTAHCNIRVDKYYEWLQKSQNQTNWPVLSNKAMDMIKRKEVTCIKHGRRWKEIYFSAFH